MANLFSVLPNIQLTATEIAEAELFAQQYLQALYPDLDLREGTGIRDLVLRPSATLIALVNKGLDYYFETNTIAGVTDDSPQDVVDAIMSNLFIERNEGTRAKVAARLYFATRKSVIIPTGTRFSPDDVVNFHPDQVYSFRPSDLGYDSATGEYYVDVFLESDGEGSEYNIESGSLLFFTNFDPYFLRGEISYLKDSSTPKETNSEFIARAETAISTRNLINDPSISGKIRSEFNYVSRVVSAGFGHEEMVRDTMDVTVPGNQVATVHLGGMTDVHCAVPIIKDIEQFVVDGKGQVILEGAYVKVQPTDIQGGDLPNDIPATTPFVKSIDGYDSAGNVTTYQKDLGFSSKQKMILQYGPFYIGKVVSFETWKFQGIDSIQAFLEETANRVTCADMLAKAMPVYQLDIQVKSYSATLPTVEVLRPVIDSYLKNLGSGEPFNMSDLISHLYENTSVSSLVTPLTVNYTLHRRNGFTSTGNITDTLTPEGETYRFELNTLTVSKA